MRARVPDYEGYVERDGVKVGYEVFGSGSPTLLLLPTWTIIHTRFWKMQIPYLADHFRVVTFDRPGNGRADRPQDPGAYTVDAVVDHALAVMDATETGTAVLVSLSQGAQESLKMAAEHPERVLGTVYIAPGIPIEPGHPERIEALGRFLDPYPPNPTGWDRMNAQYWLDDYPGFVEFFFSQCFTEPHSTKQREDCEAWASETTPEVLLIDGQSVLSPETLVEWARRAEAPSLVIHGDDDHISPLARAETIARETRGELVVIEGGGHIPLARDPVKTNLLIREFVERIAPKPPLPQRWTRSLRRGRRALFVSSPIGLGHAARDIAVARELEAHHPDLEIDWLAQHPVTRMLEDAGERVHPASARLASESAHMEAESGEHRLHCFQAWRRMDEILLSDFMVFHDVVSETHYDLVIGDEAWDVDYFLHENPQLKRASYAWFTDFVGWLPMPDGGEEEAALTADLNAEMIEHRARFRGLRDRSIFVGSADDVVPDLFGPGLPSIRDWTEDEFDFAGYVTGFDPSAYDVGELRDRLGYRTDEQVCLVSVGGSGVGLPLLRRVLDAVPLARRMAPGLRFVVVAGPRIDPRALPSVPGADVHGYLPDLTEHLAACDVALTQGGLTTCMELTALRKPFVYVPLRHHFEQNFHVRRRLDQYRAGTCLDYALATEPDVLAATLVKELGRVVDYRAVETDGAARAAAMLAGLL